jgi:sulfatase maturation enzyme AslB (radical SAM superfamily)
MIDYKEILSLDLETSSLCNAKCPVCNRRESGGKKNKSFTETYVTLQNIKDWFPIDFIKQLHNISMCGNYGDSMTNPELIPILRYFKSIKPHIQFHMNTNASGRNPQFWQDLGEIFKDCGTVVFSVDGLEDTNWIYRRGTSWEKIMSAMTNYTSTGAESRWEYLVFRHNQHQVEEAKQLANDIGITHFLTKKALGFVGNDEKGTEVHDTINVFGNNAEFQYSISPPTEVKYTNKEVAEHRSKNAFIKTDQDDVYTQFEKSKNSDGIFKHKIEYVKAIDPTRPLTNYEKRLGECDIDCQAIPPKRIFISSEGLIFPCCYTGGKYYEPDNEDSAQLKTFINEYGKENISLKHNTLENIIDGELFTTGWLESFEDRDVRNKRLRVCSLFCGKGMNDEIMGTLDSIKVYGNVAGKKE